MVQGPQVDEGLRGLDAYEQMLNTFAENAKFFGGCGARQASRWYAS